MTAPDTVADCRAVDLLAALGLDAQALLRHEGLDPMPGDGLVYLSGSLVEGLGNRGSDVDLFVIGALEPRGPHVIRKDGFAISIHFAGRRRIDFEYWASGTLAAMADKLAHLRLGEDFVAEKLAPVEELFVHRLLIGLPLHDAARFAALQARFDMKRLAGYLTQQAIHRIDGAQEDLCGMLDEQQWDVAVLRSRDLLELSVDAWSFHRGRTNPLPKWRPRLLERCGDDPQARQVRRTFWELEFPFAATACPEPAAVEAHVRRCMAFSEQVVRWIQG